MKERGRSAAAILHDIEDRAVRLPHALLRQHADLGDRIVNIAADDALAVAEFAVVQIHAVAHDARIHGSGDLGRAGRLRAVADGAGEDGHGVDDRVRHGVIVAAEQVADARACTDSGGDGPAVGGEAADAGLLVDGDKVGNGQRAVELLAGRADVAGMQAVMP